MEYTFSLFGASQLEVGQLDKDTRKELYARYGENYLICSDTIFSMDLATNRVMKKTSRTQDAGFSYRGSWGNGTIEKFWEELCTYALSNGLSYTIPVYMGTSGLIDMQDCATYAEEIQLIKNEFLTTPPQCLAGGYKHWINDVEQAFLLGADYGLVCWNCD